MIENVTEALLPAYLDLIHTACGTVAEEFGLTKENCPTNGAFMPLARLQAEFAAASAAYAYIEDGRPTGFAMLCPRPGEAYKLEKLAVLPGRRRQGIGAKLVSHVCQEARALGGKRLLIGIIEENTRLCAWYESQGFVHVGIEKIPQLPFTVGHMERRL